jgi:hypothetical protein
MVQCMLDASGFHCLVGCHFSDLKKGGIDFARYVGQHEPDVVILTFHRRKMRTGSSSKRVTST